MNKDGSGIDRVECFKKTIQIPILVFEDKWLSQMYICSIKCYKCQPAGTKLQLKELQSKLFILGKMMKHEKLWLVIQNTKSLKTISTGSQWWRQVAKNNLHVTERKHIGWTLKEMKCKINGLRLEQRSAVRMKSFSQSFEMAE